MEPPEPTTSLALAAVPAVLAAAFAAGTASLAALSRSRKAALTEALPAPAAAALQRYLDKSTAIETRWFILRVVGISASAALFSEVVPEPRPLWTVACVLVAFGLPAQLATFFVRRNATTAAPLFVRWLHPFELLAFPLSFPMELLARSVLSTNSERPLAPSATVAEAEVEALVTEGELNGSLAHEQSEMIRNVLDFGEVRAGDLMVPRTRVTAVDITTSVTEFLLLVEETEHSRYPVYQETIDNVVGVLHVKDLVIHIRARGVEGVQISQVMRTPVVFVPEAQLASTVLNDMRLGRRHHMAIVIDEFGGMAGVVTLEDFVEQIVGEIRDEHDDEESQIQEVEEGRYLVDAGIPITDLEKHLGIEFPDDADYNSLGGLIVDALGRVPEVGATVSRLGYDFVVREADDRKVTRIEASKAVSLDSSAA